MRTRQNNTWRFWGMRKVANPQNPPQIPAFNATQFNESLKRGITEHDPIWQSYLNDYIRYLTNGKTGPEADAIIAKDKQDNPQYWNPGKLSSALKAYEQDYNKEMKQWVRANGKTTANPFTWGFNDIDMDERPDNYGFWAQTGDVFRNMFHGTKYIPKENIDARFEEIYNSGKTGGPIAKLKAMRANRIMGEHLKGNAQARELEYTNAMANTADVLEHNPLGAAVNLGAQLATNGNKTVLDIAVPWGIYGGSPKVESNSANALYNEAAAIDPTAAAAARLRGKGLNYLQDALYMKMMASPKHFPFVKGDPAILPGAKPYIDYSDTLKESLDMASKFGFTPSKYTASAAMGAYNNWVFWNTAKGVKDATVAVKDVGKAFTDPGTGANNVFVNYIDPTTNFASNYIDSAAKWAPTWGAASGMLGILVPQVATAHPTMAKAIDKGAPLLVNMLPSTAKAVARTVSPELEKMMFEGDATEEYNTILNMVNTNPDFQAKYNIPPNASDEEHRNIARKLFLDHRYARVESNIQKRIEGMENWASMTPEEQQKTYNNLQYEELLHDMNAGGYIDTSIFDPGLNKFTPDQNAKLFKNWLFARDKELATDMLSGSYGGQLVRALEGKPLERVMNNSKEDFDIVRAYGRMVTVRKFNGENTSEPTGVLADLERRANDAAMNVYLTATTKDQLKSDFKLAMDGKTAAENFGLLKTLGKSAKLPDKVSQAWIDYQMDRMSSDGNYLIDSIDAIKNLSGETANDPELIKYVNDNIKKIDLKNVAATLDIDHVAKLTPFMQAHSQDETSPIPGMSDDDWKQFKDTFTKEVKSNVPQLIISNPLKALPIFTGLYGASQGWKPEVVEWLKDPIKFWGSALLLLGGAALLFGGDDEDDEDDDDDNIFGGKKKKVNVYDALEAQRELLANNTVGI